MADITDLLKEEFASINMLRFSNPELYFEKLKIFIEDKINSSNINLTVMSREEGSGTLLHHITTIDLLSMQQREQLIDLLYTKGALDNPKDIYKTIIKISTKPEIFVCVFNKLSPAKKAELLELLNNPSDKKFNCFQLDPIGMRTLINIGVLPKLMSESFQVKVMDGVLKLFFGTLYTQFPTPTVSDTKEYHDFYHSDLVQIILTTGTQSCGKVTLSFLYNYHLWYTCILSHRMFTPCSSNQIQYTQQLILT